MTIKEYKQSFIKLFEQMEEEHGVVATLQMWHHRVDNDNSIECEIKI